MSYGRSFWTANGVELLERAAFYGMFISLSLYLTREVGFSDIQAGWIAGLFSGFLYFAPTFAGVIADSFGFKRSLILAFSLLTLGYAELGLFQTRPTTITALILILAGGAFIKSIISGTVAKASTEENRAKAFSIFYTMVNIGAFTGKTIAQPMRVQLGLASINLASAAMCFLSIIIVALLYKEFEQETKRNLKDVWNGLVKVVTNLRFISLIIIVGGFWAIQHQLYATMPKYVLRMVGEGAAPEWYANVNPFVVVILVMPITHLVAKIKPVSSIGIGLAIIPLSALLMAASPLLINFTGGSFVDLGFVALHPITVMMIAGIATQGLAECFLSPRFLEYASKQAPEGETGLYMGYSHLTSFFGNLLGFGISGYLLDAWCPNPEKLPPEAKLALANGDLPIQYAHAHYIWFVFAGIGIIALSGLLVFKFVTDKIDSRNTDEA